MACKLLLLLPLLAPVLASANSPCPPGWVDAFTLGMGCLYLLQEAHSWEEAGKMCKSLQNTAHLVEIDSLEQLDFLEQGLNFVDGTSWVSHHTTTGGALQLIRSWRMTGPGATQVTLFRTSSGHQDSLTTVGVCSGTENCGALVSAGGEQARYKMVDINCELDTVHMTHAPSYQIFSVCQFKQF